jgi:hypothetical protein
MTPKSAAPGPERPQEAPEAVPAPAASATAAPKKADVHPDPTRYGDWERKGRCIDF